MNTVIHDAATERLAQDNALLLAKLAQLEAKLDAVLSQAEPAPPAKPPLTYRDVSIVRLVAQGQTNRQIADTLGLAEGSVKSALDRIRRDLGAENRWHAVALARHLGLLDDASGPHHPW